ncbi:hypothetical protein HF086_008627 [Spodoptera exigua]|uniref:MADF domain-containing protein n=1 Tax=Spodoptera exigua TaxID=7107 RepID=A0A922M7C9_SPOEX|nr:hypothetical protein HF086_008627 [Spodoptera exigua]
MEERADWSGDALVRLLAEYRKRPELWYKGHRLYREHSAKYESWSELAALFHCTIAELRKKLNSIFASYRREKSKIRHGGSTHWFLYDHLKFLPDHVATPASDGNADGSHNENALVTVAAVAHPYTCWFIQPLSASSNYATESRSGESSDNNEEEEVEEEEEQTEDREQQVIIKQEPSTSETSEKQPSAPAQPRKRGRRKMFPRSKLTQPMKRKQLRGHDALDNKLLEALKILKKSDLSRKKDECDSFGEYIAISLRKHDERTQSMIKQAINNILFEQEMRMYSVGQYTVVLTGDDENPLVCEEK